MKQKNQKHWMPGIVVLMLFVLYTLSLTWVDRQPVGPGGAYVPYARLNQAVHELFGVNMTLCRVTDWAGAAAVGVTLPFAALGLVQWIGRKHIRNVDGSLLLLGVLYMVVFGVYVFFEMHVINVRPVLINGMPEASYPSSTTMLTLCILPTAMMQCNRRLRNRIIRKSAAVLGSLWLGLVVIGRLVCGVHWFTDILGAWLFSAAMLLLYRAALRLLGQ